VDVAQREDGLAELLVPQQVGHCPGRRKGRLSALRTHTKAPYKTDLHWKTLMKAKAA
jgi:hypothetical protein